MNEREQHILLAAQALVKQNLGGEPTGHDFYHVERVVGLAKHIAKTEGPVDAYVLELACWLHDIDDRKIVYQGTHIGVDDFLRIHAVEPTVAYKVVDIIDNLSYASYLKGKKETTLEGKIAQDADRLDALGAVGIARAFAYGGNKGRMLLDESKATPATIDHFDEKLFKLEALMNTQEGQRLSKTRSAFMKTFVETFFEEVNFDKSGV
jgi:uncharacterized protein